MLWSLFVWSWMTMTKSPKVASDTGASVTVPPFDSTPLMLAKALTVFEKSKLAETLDHLPAFLMTRL